MSNRRVDRPSCSREASGISGFAVERKRYGQNYTAEPDVVDRDSCVPVPGTIQLVACSAGHTTESDAQEPGNPQLPASTIDHSSENFLATPSIMNHVPSEINTHSKMWQSLQQLERHNTSYKAVKVVRIFHRRFHQLTSR